MRSRAIVVALGALGAAIVLGLSGGAPASAQVPGLFTTTTASPDPTPTTEAPPSTTAPPATAPPDEPSPTVTTTPAAPPPAESIDAPPAPPAVSATPTPTATTVPTGNAGAVRRPIVSFGGLTTAAVTGVYSLAVATVLLSAAGLIALSSTVRPGGLPVTKLRTNRLALGAACLVLAAIVGLLGYLKLSLEPAVNRQIPYLASAGMALVVLTVLGGALIVGEQMRTDQARIEELERAVERLAGTVSESVERPPRTRKRA